MHKSPWTVEWRQFTSRENNSWVSGKSAFLLARIRRFFIYQPAHSLPHPKKSPQPTETMSSQPTQPTSQPSSQPTSQPTSRPMSHSISVCKAALKASETAFAKAQARLDESRAKLALATERQQEYRKFVESRAQSPPFINTDFSGLGHEFLTRLDLGGGQNADNCRRYFCIVRLPPTP